MTKAPETVQEAKDRQNTIAGGLGALGSDPIVEPEKLPKDLGAVISERKARRHARTIKNMNWK